MAKTNQEKLDDLWWILCSDDGRQELFKWMRDSARTVLLEPAVLDVQALAHLKRRAYLVDPTAKTRNIVGTTDHATKINWDAYLAAQNLNAVVAVGEQVSTLAAIVIKALAVQDAPECKAPVPAPLPAALTESAPAPASVEEGGK